MDKNDEEFRPFVPSEDVWSLFKFASLARLEQMQSSGLLYMNSLKYFSALNESTNSAIRADPLEKIYEQHQSGLIKGESLQRRFILQIEDGPTIDAGPEAVLSMGVTDPSNTMIYCMSALNIGPNGVIPGTEAGVAKLDNNFLEFGSHVLLIRDLAAFFERINKAISKIFFLYTSRDLHANSGSVEYMDLNKYNGHIGVFRKDSSFAWQREFRIAFCVPDSALNDNGAFELEIGDISDISSIKIAKSFVKRGVPYRLWSADEIVGNQIIKRTEINLGK